VFLWVMMCTCMWELEMKVTLHVWEKTDEQRTLSFL